MYSEHIICSLPSNVNVHLILVLINVHSATFKLQGRDSWHNYYSWHLLPRGMERKRSLKSHNKVVARVLTAS